MAGTRDVDNTLFIPVAGMNEAVLDQQINANEFFYLQGLVHDKVGQLRLLYAKRILFRQGNSPVLGIYPFGDFILVETRESIIRYSNQEFFDNGETIVPILTPDVYPEGGETTEADEYALVQYSAAQGIAGDTFIANTWKELDTHTWSEISDPNTHISFPFANNVIRISASAYPVNVRLKGVAVGGSTTGGTAAKLQFRLKNSGGGSPITYSESVTTSLATTNNSLAILQDRFTLAGATDFVMEGWASTACFARSSGIGTEVYASLKFIFE